MRINLKAIRIKRRISQQKLAELSGVKQAIISQIETEYTKNPGIFTLQKLAVALHCTVDDLIEEEESAC